jgi:CrcB protein
LAGADASATSSGWRLQPCSSAAAASATIHLHEPDPVIAPGSVPQRAASGAIEQAAFPRTIRRLPTREGSMNGWAVIAVFAGAGLGALLRWAFSLWLNPVFPTVPLGTLASNLVGGLLVGVCAAWFARHADVAPEWRLLVITGFLGGLTTFSTFSAEVVRLIGEGELGWAAVTAGTHLLGSLALTATGIALVHAFSTRAAA